MKVLPDQPDPVAVLCPVIACVREGQSRRSLNSAAQFTQLKLPRSHTRQEATTGHYAGGHGSSHKGGHYKNSNTGNHYRYRQHGTSK